MNTIKVVAVLALFVFLGSVIAESPKPVERPSDDLPGNFTVGILTVYNIAYGPVGPDHLYGFSAQAVVALPDSQGSNLLFEVTGEVGVSPWVAAFSGKQNGTWSPFPTKDLELSFLSVTYNSTTSTSTISGGSTFGAWTVEVDLDFSKQTGPAIGFVVTDAKPSFNGLPGAPDHAYDALDSLLNVGIVISSFEGSFHFESGATVTVHSGINIFAASVFDGVTIQYTGQIHFAGGFSVTITATADNFQLGTGVAVSSAVITVQFPTQPFLSMTLDANWAGLDFTLQGTLSTTDIQFTGNAPGPWNIQHGTTPVVVSQMLITFDHTYGAGTTGELRGAVQWGTYPQIEGIMKYPADSQALGCFSLTVVIGAPSSGPSSMDAMVLQAVGTPSASDSFPTDTHELFGNTLQDITLSAYPDCGALYVGAQLDTTTFGTVDLGFAMFEYAPISSVLQAFADGLPDDPPVPISGGASYTVGAKEVLSSAAIAFDTVQPPILVAEAYIIRQAVGKAMGNVMQTVSSMRQQLLVQLTEHKVQVDALSLLQSAATALAAETWKAPDHYANSTWEWMASLSFTGADWPISEPKGVYLTSGSFALASATFQMTVGDSSIMAQVGFNFLANIDVSQSTLPALDSIKTVDSCTTKTFQVSGYIGNNETGWFLQGALTDGCISFGPNMQISDTSLRVQSAEPQASFTTVVTLPQTQDLQFQMSAQVSASGGTTTIQLSGATQSVYQTHVGADPLEIDNLNLQLTVTVGATSALAGTLSGAVTIDDQTEVSASSQFDSSTKALAFSLTIHEDKPVYMFNLLKLLIGEDAYNKIPMPESGKEKLAGVYFVEGTLSLSTQPPSLSGGLQVIAFYKEMVSASISFSGGHVAFGFSVQSASGMLDPIKLSDILPNITIVDEFRMKTPVIIIADAPAQLSIPGISVSFNVKTGFNFAAYLALDNTTARSQKLTEWLGDNSVMVQGVIDPAGADFELQAQAALADVPIVPGADLTDAGFFINVQGASLNVGFDASCKLVMGSTPTAGNTLILTVTMDVGTAGASFKANIAGPWNNPFGVNGVTLLSGTVSLSLGGSFALADFGISGTMQVGQVQGTATFIADGLVIGNTVFAVSLQSMSLERDILQAICGKTPADMFTDPVMQTATFSVNPTLHTVQTFPPGIAVAVTGFKVGSIILQTVSFAVDPVLGVRIEVDAKSSGTSSITVGANNLVPLNEWDMVLDLMLSTSMGIHINGQITLLAVQAAAKVDIDLHQFGLAINFTSGVLTLDMAGSVGAGSDPFAVVDMNLSGDLSLGDYLSTRLLYYAQQTEDQKGPEIKDIQNKIASLQADIATLQQEIDNRSQNDTAAKQAAEQAVQNAQNAVTDAKNKVQDLNNQIAAAQDQLKQCGKYDYVCQAKYKAEIISLQAALLTADGALDAATAILNAAMAALQKIPDPDVDPQIIAWKAEQVGDEALVGTLQATLAADQALTQLASNVLTAGAKALQPTSITWSTTSFVGIKGGSPGNADIVGSFLGKPVNFNVGIIITNVEQFVSDVWTALQKLA